MTRRVDSILRRIERRLRVRGHGATPEQLWAASRWYQKHGEIPADVHPEAAEWVAGIRKLEASIPRTPPGERIFLENDE